MSSNELLMQRAHDLALNGLGNVSPNPLVGCVIVKDEVIIGESWHKKFGGPHAEVNAIASVTDKQMIVGSTVIVNLEPCSHHGKTPPCADLLISHKVGSVVISNVDTNPLVSGKGVAKLRAAGIEVTTQVLEAAGHHLNRRFFTMTEKRRPYIILKWAQTENGLLSGDSGDPRWISNSVSRQLVHRWRAEEDAVLVGSGTVVKDNPQLDVREWTGRNPLRIVIDKKLTLPQNLKVFDGTQPTIVFNTLRNEERRNVSLVSVEEASFTEGLLDYLFAKGVQSLLIEGGSNTLDHFIRSGTWDEARVFEAPIRFQQGLKAPIISGEINSVNDVAGDRLIIYQNLIPTAIPVQ